MNEWVRQIEGEEWMGNKFVERGRENIKTSYGDM